MLRSEVLQVWSASCNSIRLSNGNVLGGGELPVPHCGHSNPHGAGSLVQVEELGVDAVGMSSAKRRCWLRVSGEVECDGGPTGRAQTN